MERESSSHASSIRSYLISSSWNAFTPWLNPPLSSGMDAETRPMWVGPLTHLWMGRNSCQKCKSLRRCTKILLPYTVCMPATPPLGTTTHATCARTSPLHAPTLRPCEPPSPSALLWICMVIVPRKQLYMASFTTVAESAAFPVLVRYCVERGRG